MISLAVLGFVVLPVVITIAYAAVKWNSLRRPWLFLFGGVAEGYAAAAGIAAIAFAPLTTIGVSGVARSGNANWLWQRFVVAMAVLVLTHLFALWVTFRGMWRRAQR